jgi:S1-C subfamily serine protease
LEEPELSSETEQTEITGNNVLSGVVVTNVTPENTKKFNLAVDKGALVIAAPEGKAVLPGDVIVELNGKTIAAAADVANAVKGGGSGFSITLQRGLTTIRQSVIK